MRILAIGECMAELAPLGGPGEFKIGYAGDTFNTAWYLAKISPNTEVAYFTTVGDDKLSREMRAFIDRTGIDTSHICEIPDGTMGLYMIHLSNGERSFSYWRNNSAAKRLADDPDALGRAIEKADLIYYSGITLGILGHQSRENLLGALQRGRDVGKTVAFDTNIRPKLWSSTEEMKRSIMRAAELSNIVLPSFDDESAWFNDDCPTATLERYARLGVERIVVKNGEHSVVYQDGNIRGEVPTKPETSAIDTTAAGDSFNAGVLLSVSEKSDFRAGISLGCKLASYVIQAKGALVPVDALRVTA